MLKAAPLLLLLALPASSPRVAPAYIAKVTDSRTPASSIQSLPPSQAAAAVDDALRLLPDHRFLLAISDIYALRTGTAAPAEVQFKSGAWEVTCGGKRAGTLPLLPAFNDAMTLLEAWAHSLAPRAAEPPVAFAKVDRLIAAFDRKSLYRAMQILPAPPVSDKSAARAARAVVYLNVQLTDSFELADSLSARAVALLAIARADDAKFGDEELALLASALGYDVEARALALRLPAGSAAQVKTGTTAAAASMLQGPPLLAYLAAEKLITSKDNNKAIADFRKRSPDVAMPALLRVVDFDQRAVAARSARKELINEVAGSPEFRELPLQQFESSIDSYARRHASALLDASLIRMSEEALVYSTIDQEYAFYFSQLASRSSAEGFVQSLGESDLQPAHDIRAVLAATNDIRWNGARGVRPSVPATLTHVGAGTRAALFMRVNDAVGELLVGDATQVCSQLDSRPAQLSLAVEIAGREIIDPSRRDLWFAALLDRAPAMFPAGHRSWFYKLTGNLAGLREIASSPRFSSDERAIALKYLGDAGEGDFAAPAFEKLMEETGYAAYSTYADFLNKRRDWKRKETAARRCVELSAKNGPIAQAYCASSLADALEEQGRYDEAWAVAEPHIEAWSANIVSGAISILERRGHIAESDALAQQYLQRYPDTASRTSYAVVLWRQHRWDDAAKLFDPKRTANNESQWAQWMPDGFERNLRDTESAVAAFDALRRVGVSGTMLAVIIRDVAKTNPAMAVTLMERLRDPAGPYDANAADADIAEFEAREASGDSGAMQWLRARTPDNAVGSVVFQLLRAGRYEAVLAVATGRPAEAIEKDLQCLYLAIALIGAHVPADDPRFVALRRDLEALPPVTSSDSPRPAARFAAGLVDEETASKTATDAKGRSIIDFIIGLKLAAAGNYDAALPHVLAAAQRSRELTIPQAFAIDLLQRWNNASASWPEVARRGIL